MSTIGSIKFKNQFKNNVDESGNYNILAPDGSKLVSFTPQAQLSNCTISQMLNTKADVSQLTILENRILALEQYINAL